MVLPFTAFSARFCIPVLYRKDFYAFWIPILAFESLLFGLVLSKAIRTYKSEDEYTIKQRRTITLILRGRKLMDILIRDSAIYFLA